MICALAMQKKAAVFTSDSLTIVLFEVGALGDSIMTLPAMSAIRASLPCANIIRVHSAATREFWCGCPYTDVFCPYDKNAPKWQRAYRLLKFLRGIMPDVMINLHTPDFARPLRLYVRDDLFMLISGAAERRGYYYSWDRCLLSSGVSRHEFGANRLDQEILKIVGLSPNSKNGQSHVGENPTEPLSYWLTEADRQRARTLMAGKTTSGDGASGYFCVSPFARNPLREWQNEKVAQATQQIAEATGKTPVFLGGPQDLEKMAAIKALLDPQLNYIDLVGIATIKDAAAILENAKLAIAVDSGLMHLASLMGSPTVGIFGPGNPVRWHPIGRGRFVAVHQPLDCHPCYRRECSDRRCADRISVEQVVRAAITL
jgi:ADP-heptose:LPS heptosyltransferase